MAKGNQIVYANGRFIDAEDPEAAFPFEERGFQFGDGIYEVIRVYGGKYYTLEQHVERLYRSLREIRLSVDLNQEELKKTLKELLALNEFKEDGSVYLQVTRGSAPRNHLFPVETPPNIIAYTKRAPRPAEQLRQGISVHLHEDIRWLRCDIKSLNLLPNVLAKQEASELGHFEAMLHRGSVITECSSSNVYLVRNNTIFTHPTTNLILNGITRQRIRLLCEQHGLLFAELPFSVDDVHTADEMFLSSTTAEVMPVIAVDDQTIGNGTPGPLTRKLQALFEADAGIN